MSSWFTRGSRWYVYVVSFVVFVVGMAMIVLGASHVISGQPLQVPPAGSTQAQVATVADFSCGSTDPKATAPCQVTISYVVDVGHGPARTFTTATSRQYRIGDRVTLWVSDSDPTHITQFETTGTTINAGLVLGLGCMGVVGVLANLWLVSKSTTAANVEGGVALVRNLGRWK